MVVEYNLPFRVTVSKEGTVSKVRQMDGTPVTDPFIIGAMKTVDQAFNTIKDAWSYAATVSVEYDADKGYPTECHIDASPDIADEDIIFKITDVTLR